MKIKEKMIEFLIKTVCTVVEFGDYEELRGICPDCYEANLTKLKKKFILQNPIKYCWHRTLLATVDKIYTGAPDVWTCEQCKKEYWAA